MTEQSPMKPFDMTFTEIDQLVFILLVAEIEKADTRNLLTELETRSRSKNDSSLIPILKHLSSCVS